MLFHIEAIFGHETIPKHANAKADSEIREFFSPQIGEGRGSGGSKATRYAASLISHAAREKPQKPLRPSFFYSIQHDPAAAPPY